MIADSNVPGREDRFSFGLWTVGWQGVDVLGSATRLPMPAERAVRKLTELGAYGVNFHDNDLFEFGDSAAARDERISAFNAGVWVPDVDALGRRGVGFERLDQLELEYLYGAR